MEGNHFVDANGATVQLRGVNISGLEFVAIQGWSPSNPWGGQTGDPTPNFSAIKTWDVNAVRLPLNEASWLGLSCADLGGVSVTVNSSGATVHDQPGQIIDADPGHNYQATVEQTVQQANAAGMYVILDLHLAAPDKDGTPACPEYQNAMADEDHSIAFWTSLANTFKNNPAVIFELYNEAFISQSAVSAADTEPAEYVELNGWDQPDSNGDQLEFDDDAGLVNMTWSTAGFQEMLNAVRTTGATNVVLVGADHYTTDMTLWLKYLATDPIHQLGAAWHPYPAGYAGYPNLVNCAGEPQCAPQEMQAAQNILAAGYPIVATEFGDTITSSPSSTAPWASVLLPFADQNGFSYIAWTWDNWGNAPSNLLIRDKQGDPTYGYGTYIKQHYLCVASGQSNCP